MNMRTVLCAFVLFFIASCDKANDRNVLIGQWDVTQVKGVLYLNGSALPPIIDSSPTGYVKFNANGTGEQNYSFSVLGQSYPNTGSFVWTADEHAITIQRVNEPDLVWRRNINEADKQEATYNIVVNSNQNWDYTLTLEK